MRTLVDMHEGSSVAESAGLGKGSQFRVRLPLAAQPSVDDTAAVPVETTGVRKILLVDDNADARELLRALCDLHGHRVAEAEDGPSGVERGVAFRPDIAFIDIGLPGYDGYEVARQLRKRLVGHRARLIALTGYGSDEHRRIAIDAGFDEHVVKPIDLATLTRLLA